MAQQRLAGLAQGSSICSGRVGRCCDALMGGWHTQPGCEGNMEQSSFARWGHGGDPALCQLRGVSYRHPCHLMVLPLPSWLVPAGSGISILVGTGHGCQRDPVCCPAVCGARSSCIMLVLPLPLLQARGGEGFLRATSPGVTRGGFCPSVCLEAGMSLQAALQPLCLQLPRGCDGADPVWAPAPWRAQRWWRPLLFLSRFFSA